MASKYAQVNVKFGADISQFSTAMQNAAREMKKAGDQLQSVGKSMTINLTAPIVALGAAALYSFGQIDSLKRGLISFSGSAKLAEEEFTKLREVAKLPGIGLEEAVKGSINLQAIGMSADDARVAMKAFGNAIATVGGGKESFDLAIRGFSQLTNASRPLQQDLYQIANQLPQVNKLMIEAFGTNRAEDLAQMGISGKQLAQFLVDELGKLPAVSGGIKNAFENMSDSVKISLASFGEAIEKNFDISGKINALSDWLSRLVEGFKNLDPTVQKFILGAIGIVAALGPLAVVIGGLITLLPTFLAGISALGAAFTVASGPIGMAIIGLGLLSALFYKLATDTTRFEDAEKDLAKTINDANSQISAQKTKIDELHGKLLNTNLSQDERNRLIKEFNSISGANLTNIGNETTFQNNLAKAYKDVNAQMQAKKYHVLDLARTQKEADLEKIKQDIKLAEIAAEKYKKENIIFNTPFGPLTKTPISDLFGTPMQELEDLRDQAEATRQSIQGLSRELYNISPSGEVAEITTPTKITMPPLIPKEKETKEERERRLLKEWEENEAAQNEIAIRLSQNDSIARALEGQSNEQTDVVGTGWDNTTIQYQSGTKKFTQAVIDAKARMLAAIEELNVSIKQALQQGLVMTIEDSFAQIGENIAMNEDPFKNVGKVLLDSIGKLMKTIGGLFITMGVAQLQFEVSLAELNPFGMIAAGAVLVAAGAAISSTARKGLKGQNAASSEYTGNSGNSGSTDLQLHSRLDGRDIVMSGQTTTYVQRR